MDYQFWVTTAILVVTIFAIVIGPLKAVYVQKNADEERGKVSRKYMILSSLMRTRQSSLDPDRVSALNLVQLEFYGRVKVISAYKSYSDHLNSHFPTEQQAIERHVAKGNNLFVELLFEIASELGFAFDKNDLHRLSYFPTGLGEFNENARVNLALMREILEGRRPLGITNFVSSQGIFPPAPQSKT